MNTGKTRKTVLLLVGVLVTSLFLDVSIAKEDVTKAGEVYSPRGDYEILVVPDTVDLARHAELALNVLTRTNNPHDRYNTYFNGKIIYNPPRLYRSWEPAQWKLAEPLTLTRMMTGCLANTEVDRGWAEWLYDLKNKFRHLHVVYIGRGLVAIARHYQLTNDPVWKQAGQEMIDILIEVCPSVQDFSYYPPNMDFQLDPTRSRKMEDYHEDYPTGWPAMGDAWLVQGLCAYYRETNYLPAIKLAKRLVRHMRYYGKIFDKQGRFIAAHDGFKGPNTAIHFYRHVNSLLSFIEYALVTGDRELAEFVKKSYLYARSTGTPQIGFFPEYLTFPDDRQGIIDCESCVVGHMASLAVKLTQTGVGNYWEDIDGYVRNMLTEMQMKSSKWIYDMVKNRPVTPVNPELEDTFQAAERLVGIFPAWASANEFCVWGEGTTQCCAANPPRALYYVWHQMISEDPDTMTIELLLNRVSASANITSDLPYAGKFTVHLKRDISLRIRKPAWLDTQTISILSNPTGQIVPFKVDKDYLCIDKRGGGEQLVFTFDLPEKTLKTKVGHIDATITLRGNEVVKFEPPGKNYPFWQNKDVSRNAAPETVRTYFITGKKVKW